MITLINSFFISNIQKLVIKINGTAAREMLHSHTPYFAFVSRIIQFFSLSFIMYNINIYMTYITITPVWNVLQRKLISLCFCIHACSCIINFVVAFLKITQALCDNFRHNMIHHHYKCYYFKRVGIFLQTL